MNNKEHNGSLETQLRRYILGQLSEEEQKGFEERLLSDDPRFREADGLSELVQDELAEDYLSGDLTTEERRAFEFHLLPCVKMRESIQLHQALQTIANRKPPKPSWAERVGSWLEPVFRPGTGPAPALALRPTLAVAATVLAVLTLSAASLLYQSGQLRNQLDVAQQRILEMQLQDVGGQPAVPVASFLLSAGLQRSGGETTRVTVSPGQSLLELKLDVGLTGTYQAALLDSTGEKRVEWYDLQAVQAGDTYHVVIQLPVQNLRSDDYQIRLTDQEFAESYDYYFPLILQ